MPQRNPPHEPLAFRARARLRHPRFCGRRRRAHVAAGRDGAGVMVNSLPVAQSGSAPALGAGGRRFESDRADHFLNSGGYSRKGRGRTVNPLSAIGTVGSNPSPPTIFAAVAQLVEQRFCSPLVGGSNPSGGTTTNNAGHASPRCANRPGTIRALAGRALPSLPSPTSCRRKPVCPRASTGGGFF